MSIKKITALIIALIFTVSGFIIIINAVTADAGTKNWKVIKKIKVLTNMVLANYSNERNLFMSSIDGKAQYTSNNGKSWKNVKLPVGSFPWGINFINEKEGFIFGGHGTNARTL
jgi:hypothetical protein